MVTHCLQDVSQPELPDSSQTRSSSSLIVEVGTLNAIFWPLFYVFLHEIVVVIDLNPVLFFISVA